MKLKHLYCEYPECEYKTINKTLFDKHIKNHSNYSELSSEKIICHYDNCGKEFAKKQSWIMHRNMYHKYLQRVACTHPGCVYVAQSKHHLKIHLFKHSDEKPFLCEVQGCGKRFKHQCSYEKHLECHQRMELKDNDSDITSNKRGNKSDVKYKCSFDGCNKEFTSLSYMLRHKERLHSKQNKLHCEYPDCEYKTFTKRAFNKHIKSHSNYSQLSSQTIVCQYEGCDQMFTDKTSWYNHRNNYHKNKYKVPCTHPGCDYVAVSKWHLNFLHMSKHSQDRPFVCQVQGCAKSFKREDSLKNHLEMHKNDHFQCSFEGCGKTYESKGGLNSHMKLAHIRDTLYSCEWPGCDYKTYAKGNLGHHKIVHGQHKYLCDHPDCKAKFRVKQMLNDHMLKLHGIGQGLKCSWPGCEFKSVRMCTIKYHERIHTNERRFACTWPGCQYRCVAGGNIKGHMKMHLK